MQDKSKPVGQVETMQDKSSLVHGFDLSIGPTRPLIEVSNRKAKATKKKDFGLRMVLVTPHL